MSHGRESSAWVRGVDALLVEDDYDGEFRYDRAPVGASQGQDPRRVAYTGSVSKSPAPGPRLGWLVVSEGLLRDVVARTRMMDPGHPVVDQVLFAEFATGGAYDRWPRGCQRAYRERRDVLVAARAEHCPGAVVTGIAAGPHIIVGLPRRFGPEREFLARTARAGVAVRPPAAYGGAVPDDGPVRLVPGAPTRRRPGSPRPCDCWPRPPPTGAITPAVKRTIRSVSLLYPPVTGRS